MKQLFAGATLGALLISSLAFAETYQFQQRISGLQVAAQELTEPSPVTGVTYDETGWALIQSVSNGLEPDVTDEQWLQLRDAMEQGIRVVFADGVEWFAPAEALRSANCRSISDTNSLRSPSIGGHYVIAWHEVSGCTGGGGDYSILNVRRDGYDFLATWANTGLLFEDNDAVYRNGVETIWIK